ncbi:methyltransferase domain-containing protein [Paenibacillus sp. BR2-3]|uniref:methyltransferase domain-containing protein n=1 Tax=Paenibacillus sp. BR2-3 TaxID=3048494 RepID=UPI0039778011
MQSISPKIYWNQVFMQIKGQEAMKAPCWLERYQSYLNELQGTEILEIGCGSGNDSRCLAEQDYHLTVTDFSEAALSIVKHKVPDATLLLHDTKDPFPLADNAFDAIIASLSLHYFERNIMNRIICEVERMLKPGGLLFVRLNSVNDPEAENQHPIERFYYSIESCREQFPDWKEKSLQEVTQDYHGKYKVIIEGIFERSRTIDSVRGRF